jgi:hypothetical protein
VSFESRSNAGLEDDYVRWYLYRVGGTTIASGSGSGARGIRTYTFAVAAGQSVRLEWDAGDIRIVGISAVAPPVTLHAPYGAVTGSGAVGSKWAWQSGSGGSGDNKLLTATGSVTLQATLVKTGGGNCDGGEYVSLGIYSAANAHIRTMVPHPGGSSGAETLTAGQYIRLELDCADGRAEVWVV